MIRLENVTKVYDGNTVAVKDATLDIVKGRVRLPRRTVRFREIDADPPDDA